MSTDGRSLTVVVQDLPLVDDVLQPTPGTFPATTTFRVEWRGKRKLKRRGRGLAVPATDPAAFLGAFFRKATARGTFSGAIEGFSFQSDPAVPAKSTFAMLGTERNGIFVSQATRCARCALTPRARGGAAR